MAATRASVQKWPYSNIPYWIEEDHPCKKSIEKALEQISDVCKLRFSRQGGPRPFSMPVISYYLQVDENVSSSSEQTGYSGGIEHKIWLKKKSTMALHETLHTLGLVHEQQRRDRNKYITVFRDHIEPGKWSQFELEYDSVLLSDYDRLSVMQYHPNWATIEGKGGSMEWSVDPSCKLGAPDSYRCLSEGDKIALRRLYSADDVFPSLKKSGNWIDRKSSERQLVALPDGNILECDETNMTWVLWGFDSNSQDLLTPKISSGGRSAPTRILPFVSGADAYLLEWNPTTKNFDLWNYDPSQANIFVGTSANTSQPLQSGQLQFHTMMITQDNQLLGRYFPGTWELWTLNPTNPLLIDSRTQNGTWQTINEKNHLRLMPDGRVLDYEPLSGKWRLWNYNSASSDVLPGSPHQSGRWATINADHMISRLPGSQFVLDWQPKLGQWRMWNYDPNSSDVLPGTPVKSGEWEEVRTARKLIRMNDNKVLDWAPATGEWTLWNFDPSGAGEVLVGNSSTPTAPLAGGNLLISNGVKGTHEIIPFSDGRILDWEPLTGKWRLWNYSASNQLFQGNSGSSSPLKHGTWNTIRSGHRLYPMSDGRVLDFESETGEWRLWNYDPNSSDIFPFPIVMSGQWQTIKNKAGERGEVVGQQQIFPMFGANGPVDEVLTWDSINGTWRLWNYNRFPGIFFKDVLPGNPTKFGYWESIKRAYNKRGVAEDLMLVPLSGSAVLVWNPTNGDWRLWEYAN